MKCPKCESSCVEFFIRKDDFGNYYWEAYCSDCRHKEYVPDAIAKFELEHRR